MEIISKPEGNKTIIYIMGELDDHNSTIARTKLDEIFSNNTKPIVILDLKLLNFMDSTGIGVIIGRYKKVKDTTQIYVKNPTKTIDKIFTMSGLYDILPKI